MDVECFLERKMNVNKKLVRKKEKKLPIFESFSKKFEKYMQKGLSVIWVVRDPTFSSPLVNYV